MWRVDKIINSKSLKRVQITNTDIARLGCAAAALLIVYMLVLTVAGKPYTTLVINTVRNQDTYIYACEQQVPEIQIALFAVEAFFVAWGIRLCNATKNAPSAVNESSFIAGATATIIVLSALGLPIIYLLDLNPVSEEIIAGFVFCAGMFATLAVLFGPKALSLYLGEEVDSKMGINMKAAAAKVSQEQPTSEGALMDACARALKGLSLDDKFALCQRQLVYWRTMLMVVEERRSSDTGSGSGASSAVSVVRRNMSSNDNKSSIVDPGDPSAAILIQSSIVGTAVDMGDTAVYDVACCRLSTLRDRRLRVIVIHDI